MANTVEKPREDFSFSVVQRNDRVLLRVLPAASRPKSGAHTSPNNGENALSFNWICSKVLVTIYLIITLAIN